MINKIECHKCFHQIDVAGFAYDVSCVALGLMTDKELDILPRDSDLGMNFFKSNVSDAVVSRCIAYQWSKIFPSSARIGARKKLHQV